MENKTKKKGLLERITSSRVFRVMFSRKIIVVCAISVSYTHLRAHET